MSNEYTYTRRNDAIGSMGRWYNRPLNGHLENSAVRHGLTFNQHASYVWAVIRHTIYDLGEY